MDAEIKYKEIIIKKNKNLRAFRVVRLTLAYPVTENQIQALFFSIMPLLEGEVQIDINHVHKNVSMSRSEANGT